MVHLVAEAIRLHNEKFSFAKSQTFSRFYAWVWRSSLNQLHNFCSSIAYVRQSSLKASRTETITQSIMRLKAKVNHDQRGVVFSRHIGGLNRDNKWSVWHEIIKVRADPLNYSVSSFRTSVKAMVGLASSRTLCVREGTNVKNLSYVRLPSLC